jgi:hypothetical protein
MLRSPADISNWTPVPQRQRLQMLSGFVPGNFADSAILNPAFSRDLQMIDFSVEFFRPRKTDSPR